MIGAGVTEKQVAQVADWRSGFVTVKARAPVGAVGATVTRAITVVDDRKLVRPTVRPAPATLTRAPDTNPVPVTMTAEGLTSGPPVEVATARLAGYHGLQLGPRVLRAALAPTVALGRVWAAVSDAS